MLPSEGSRTSIEGYVLYQFSTDQMRQAYSYIFNADMNLLSRVGSSALHAILGLGGFFAETVFWGFQRTYASVFSLNNESGSSPTLVRVDSAVSAILPLSRSSSSESLMRELPSVGDTGLDYPVWFCAIDPVTGEEQYVLHKLLPLRFLGPCHFIRREGRLEHPEGLFSLYKTVHLLYTGRVVNQGDFEFDPNYPAIGFECERLRSLLSAEELADSIPEYALHCSEKAQINLPQEMRQDYVIDEHATSYRFIYPIQLHPERGGRFIERLLSDGTISPFIKGLLLIGGYAYYDVNDNLVQVKAFSASTEATEVLPTGKALNVSRIQFPERLLAAFKLGVNMTSGEGVWEGQNNLLSPYANRITAPTLQHLSHFAYIPQSLYQDSQRTVEAAPLGGFLYRTKNNQYQFVPIGGDFCTERPLTESSAVSPATSQEEIDQNNERKNLCRIFYHENVLNTSHVNNLASCLRSARIRENIREISIDIDGYTITALQGRTIKISNEAMQSEQATIEWNGSISRCNNKPLFTQLFHEAFLRLMRDIIKIDRTPYGGEIRTIEESIDFIPVEHLQRLVEVLGHVPNGRHPCIRYLDLDERSFIAIDAGGVFRAYNSELFFSLLRNTDIFEKVSHMGVEDENDFFQLKASGGSSETILQNIGFLFGWIYQQNGNFPIGQKLSPSFFDFLFFCLKNANPSDYDLLEFVKTKTESWKRPLINYINAQAGSGEAQLTEEVRALIQGMYDVLPEDRSYLQDGEVLTERRYMQQIKEDIKDLLLQPFKEILRSYLAIGRGFRQQVPDIGRSLRSAELLNRSIQGCISKQQVARAIRYVGANRSVQNKTEWIKQWVLSPATTIREVEDFLQVVTGAKSLGSDSHVIRINEMAVTSRAAFPRYHSCFSSIDMPHGGAIDTSVGGAHRNKEEFLRSFKEGLQQALLGFSMG